MSLRSPDVDASSSRDPFELDRLAEELVNRERSHIPDDDDDDAHELPDDIPLAHNNPYLTADSFSVEDFLLSRSQTSSLPDLRVELKEYLSTLKEELVKLINDDYEAFISLSTDLRGEGVRLNRIKHPLKSLKSHIEESKQELRVIQDAIEDKLQKRAVLREEKTLLHLLLKISDHVARLESLLLISSAQNDDDAVEMNDLKGPNSGSSEQYPEDVTRGNRAKHLNRVAAEYTQLLYHTSKARLDNCVFVEKIQWRIDRIQSTLSSDLDHLFASTLQALTDGRGDGRVPEAEKAKWMADLADCLRTYDVLGLWRDAEDVLRREVLRGFVKKTIFPGALAAPHSPIVPHTPFHSSTTPAFLSSATLLPPRTPYTPYTPFTAFHAKQAPSTYALGKSQSPYAHFLDESDEPLAKLYSQVLRFVERDLCRIMDVAEKVFVKSVSSSGRPDRGDASTPQSVVAAQSAARPDGEGFEILANVVWEVFGRAIMDDLGNSVFAAGRPNEFRKNYEITQAFIRSLEFLAPSVRAIENMRSHPLYTAFERRWQLPVYYQLRWKEIVGRLEEVLAVTRIEPSLTKAENSFVTVQAAAVWTAISACWSAEVYIPELSHRFWRLTLQFLSRFKTWLEQSLPDAEQTSKGSGLVYDKIPGSASSTVSRSSTPGPVDASAESHVDDDAILRQCATAVVDIIAMQSSVRGIWNEEISMMLPETSDTANDEDVQPEAALEHALSGLGSLQSPLSTQIVSLLSKRCCDALLPVRSIPSQFRAMSNKRSPSEPSHFVPTIFRPIKVFFGIGAGDGYGAALKNEYLKAYAAEIFESVSQRYIHYIIAMRKTEESLRRLKKGKKSTFSLFGTANAGKDDESRDEERIRQQMILDVAAFGKDAQSLGVDVQNNDTFKSLDEMVHIAEAQENAS